jgi:hypothetical protein
MRTKQVVVPAYGNGIRGDALIDFSIQCLACKNLHNDMSTCKAFQKGIPTKIIVGHFDHTRPFPGDNGIRFVRVI